MAITFPRAQAIRFLETDELTFNETDLCGCPTDEKFAYQFTQGDNISFQLSAGCTESEDLILNGSFEDGESATSIDNWARDVTTPEQTNVQRVLDTDAPCGSYIARWLNQSETPAFAQLEQNYTFVQGKTYKLTFRTIYTTSGFGNGVGNALKITLGGQEYFVTPTTSWETYEIIVTFSDAPSAPYIDFSINEIAVDIETLSLDCVTMVEIGDCCITEHINNGCFELGQQSDGEITPTFDNWILNNMSESLTGGLNGSRCVIFDANGSTIEQINVLIQYTDYTLKFYAKSDVAGTTIDVYVGATVIETIILTTDWVEYTLTFNSGASDNIKFELTGDEISYLDCVELISTPALTFYIKDIINDSVQLISQDSVSVFEDVINVSFNVDDYEMPTCFRICAGICLDGLFLNPDFAQGSGDLFTDWTLTQPSRTNVLLQSKTYSSATWAKSEATIVANKLTENSANSTHQIGQSSIAVANATKYQFYVDAKASGRNWFAIQLSAGVAGTPYAVFNLATGTIGTQFGTPNARIFLLENGYYRCVIEGTTNSTSASVTMYLLDADNSFTYLGDGTSGVDLDNSQVEVGDFTTPPIITTTLAVTTSVGEFLQDATGGIGSSRCLKMWVDTSAAITQLVQSVVLTDSVTYTIGFWAKLESIYGNDEIVVAGQTIDIDSTDWKFYEVDFVQSGSGSTPIAFLYRNDLNFGFISLDNVQIAEQGTNIQQCSEVMNYEEDLDPCYKELVWYDNKDETLGINYASGFKNRMRVKAQAQNPQYIKEIFTKTLNGTESIINSIKVKKTIDLNFDSLPEFIWDILANMIGVSNIEYNGKNYTPVIETEVTPQPDKNTRLYSGVVTLGIEGEYIAESTFNCP